MPKRNFRAVVPLAFWILVALPILLQLPVLLGRFDSDPLLFVGAVGDSAQHISGTPWIDPNVGFQAQALGKLSADQLLAGHLPWWNPYNGVGLPLTAEAQPGSLFLPFVLLYHFREGIIWVKLLLQIIAGLSTYALLRKIKLTELAALAGAILFEFNGTFAWHGAPIVTPIAFLPMLLLGVEQLIERVRDHRPGGWLLIPIALAWSLYAGFPETAYIDGLFVALWVLIRASELPGRSGLLLLGKLMFSVCVGLACSFPLIIPFAEYVARSYVGGHGGAFAHAAFHAPAAALSLLPGLYGQIFSFNDPSNEVFLAWGNIGGYLTALQIVFALLAIQLVPRRLTLALLIWMALCLCKSFDIRPISDFMNLFPLVKSAAFYRYSAPSWEFAATILIAMGMDAWQRGIVLNHRRILFTFALTATGTIATLWLSREPIAALSAAASSSHYVHLALAWFVVSFATALTLILWKQRAQHGPHLMAVLVVVDALFAFALPMRSGARHAQFHEPAIPFLQSHTGLQRTYSLGPMAPNYGAYFKIAQINHNYLPVSSDWLEYIHQHLDPAADKISFTGGVNRQPSYGSAADQLQQHLTAYEELGVKYVLVSPGIDPFAEALTIQSDSTSYHAALALVNDQSAVTHWQIPARNYEREINKVSILIGTYGAKANGVLTAQICLDKKTCASGRRPLSESTDNTPFTITLNQALTIAPTTNTSMVPLTLSFTHSESTYPVAIWVFGIVNDQASMASLEGSPVGTAPTINLFTVESSNAASAHEVYSGPDMSVYELPYAKPYFEITQGSCTVQALSRDQAQASCSTSATLLRREAFYPGWTATVDGHTEVPKRAHEIFQSVPLTSGTHSITFSYRPTYYWLILAGFTLGIFALLWGTFKELMLTRLLSNGSR
jgi:hypothetical protein